MPYLITGGCGFLGSNLAAALLAKKEKLILFDNLSRLGSESNLNWLRTLGDFTFIQGDIRDDSITKTIKTYCPHTIFHLAGQVAMTTSIHDPRKDFEINSLGTLNLLESVRHHCNKAIIIYSSTNKVYGDLEQFEYDELDQRYEVKNHPRGFDEQMSLNFHSPYGCSKGAADQYMLDYARIYGLNTVVFRHSSIFGIRQFSTYDQGWVGWFIKQAIETSQHETREPFTISGNGKQVRDILFSDDLINCYFQAAQHISACRGQAFNIGGGYENSLSILELLLFLEEHFKIKLHYTFIPWRQSDQKVYISRSDKAKDYFNWTPLINKKQGLTSMIEWMQEHG